MSNNKKKSTLPPCLFELSKDGGARTVFNGHVRSFEELKLINDLVL